MGGAAKAPDGLSTRRVPPEVTARTREIGAAPKWDPLQARRGSQVTRRVYSPIATGAGNVYEVARVARSSPARARFSLPGPAARSTHCGQLSPATPSTTRERRRGSRGQIDGVEPPHHTSEWDHVAFLASG